MKYNFFYKKRESIRETETKRRKGENEKQDAKLDSLPEDSL